MTPEAKSAVMIGTCVIVAVFQTFILKGFLKKLKKIEHDFWGATAKQAKEDLDKARAEERKIAEEAAQAEAESSQ